MSFEVAERRDLDDSEILQRLQSVFDMTEEQAANVANVELPSTGGEQP